MFFHIFLCCLVFWRRFVDSHGFAFLFGVEAEVFEQEHLSGFEGISHSFGVCGVGSELHFATEGFADGIFDLEEAEFGVDFAFGFPHVRHDDEAAAVIEYFLKSREGTANTGVVCDVTILVEGYIEVHADESLFTCEIVIFYLCHFF